MVLDLSGESEAFKGVSNATLGLLIRTDPRPAFTCVLEMRGVLRVSFELQ